MIRLLRILAGFSRAVEADLALRGIDLRDHYRPQSGPSRLTARRLIGLIDALPADSLVWREIAHENKRKAERAFVTRLRNAKERFDARKREVSGSVS